MGMFSWLTGDTKESIVIAGTRHKNAGRTVYLLQPNGKPSIAESNYQGYGMFGGIDAFEWLSEVNLGVEDRTSGITLEGRTVMKDSDGQIYFCSGGISEVLESSLRKYLPENVTINGFEHYGVTLGGKFGDVKDVNTLVETGELVEVPVIRLLPVYYPLKFSYDKDARYESIGESEDCPDQGCP